MAHPQVFYMPIQAKDLCKENDNMIFIRNKEKRNHVLFLVFGFIKNQAAVDKILKIAGIVIMDSI